MNIEAIATPLLEGLEPEARRRLVRLFTRRECTAGESILREGVACESLLLVESGTLLVQTREQGRLGHVGAGECLGEVSLLTEQPASASVSAMTDAVLWAAPQSAVRALMQEAPGLAANVGRLLGQRLVARTARRKQSELTLLLFAGGCAGIGFARNLAASVARHSGAEVALVDLGLMRTGSGDSAPEVVPLPGVSVCEAPAADLGPDRLHALVDGLMGQFPFVLVCAPAASGSTNGDARLDALRPRSHRRTVLVTYEERLRVSEAAQAADASAAYSVELVVLGAPEPRSRALADSISRETGLPVGVLMPALPASLAGMACDWVLLHADDPFARAMGRLARRLARKRVGLALGAGAGRGHAHIWALRALERLGVYPDVIAGTSVGACIGGRYAFGDSWDALVRTLHAFERLPRRWALPIHSLIPAASIDTLFRTFLGEDLRVEDAGLPLAVIATDFHTGEEVVLRQGSAWRSARATCAIPGIFPAMPLDGRLLVDGGLVSPVPCRAARDLGADIVIGISLEVAPCAAPQHSARGPALWRRKPTWPEALLRSYDLLQRGLTQRCLQEADVAVRAFTPPTHLLDFRGGPGFVEAGECAVETARDPLAALLPWIR